MARYRRSVVGLVFLVVGIGSGGGAGYAEAEPSETRLESLPFTLTDRVDGTSGGDVQLGLTYFSETDSVFGSRTDLFFQAFSPSGGGVYAHLPFSTAHATEGGGDNLFGIGNAEVGAGYARRSGQGAFVLRGGVTAPIASSGAEGFTANMINGFGRVSDLALIAPEVSYARVSGSGILMSGNLFARADLGIDAPIWHSDEIGEANSLTHVTLGVGGVSKPGGTAFTAEFSTVSGNDSSTSTVALGVGFPGGTYLSLVTPMDDDLRGEVVVFKLGLRFGGGASARPASGGAPETSGSLAAGATDATSAESTGDPSSCAALVDRWRAETDLVRKTHHYDKMPDRCRRQLSEARAQPSASPVGAQPTSAAANELPVEP